MVVLVFAAFPAAIFYFTVKMSSPGKSWVKFLVDFIAFSFSVAIVLIGLGLFTPTALPIAFVIAYVRHKKRPAKSDVVPDGPGKEASPVDVGASWTKGATSRVGDV